MAVTKTYTKHPDGNVYVRIVRTEVDIYGTTFTTMDTEKEINHKKQLRRLKDALKGVRDDISDLQAEKERLITNITAIETARGS
jgi:hypothetical protein